MKTLLRLLGYLSHYRRQAAMTYVSLLIIDALILVVPQLIQRIIDQGLAGGDRQVLINAALLILGIALLRGFFGYWRMYLNEFLAQSVAVIRLRVRLITLTISNPPGAVGSQPLA